MHWIDTLQTSFFFGGELSPLADTKKRKRKKKDTNKKRPKVYENDLHYFHVCGIKETRVSMVDLAM